MLVIPDVAPFGALRAEWAFERTSERVVIRVNEVVTVESCALFQTGLVCLVGGDGVLATVEVSGVGVESHVGVHGSILHTPTGRRQLRRG